MSSKQRIFSSAQEIESVFGVKVVLRDNLPKNCNVVMYQIGEKPEIRPIDYFVENENGLFYVIYNGEMEMQNTSLEAEVAWDYKNIGNKSFIYLRLATKDNSDVFTPERLLGVETDKGFVEGIASVDSNIYLITGSHIISASRCKFYISDDSDETVPFEEYVRIFYEE